MTSKRSKPEKVNYEELILDHLKENPAGLTISDIANGIKASRMTVSKYISVLEAKEKIISRKIGAYNLYYTAHPVYVPHRIISLFYLGILQNLHKKQKLNKEIFYKEIGFQISDNFIVLFPPELSVPKDTDDYTIILKNLARLYPKIDVLNYLNLKIEPEITNKGKNTTFHFRDIKLFEAAEDFLYHFYVVAGVFEKTLARLTSRDVICNVDYFNLKEQSVGLKIEIK